MHRRLLIIAGACWPAVRALAQDGATTPHQKISADELRRALAARFPMRFVLPGLLDVRVDTPRLLLLAATQRVGATVAAAVTEIATRQVHACEMDWAFALRYEPVDRTVRARDLEILGLRPAGLPPDVARAWQALLADFLRGATGEIVLHQFTDRELALPDSMGFEPSQIQVEKDGLVIGFGPKARP